MNISDILPDINKDLLESLKPSEKEAVLKILSEISNKEGNSKLYKDIIDRDYEEIPVDIDTFIEDERYIGRSTSKGTTIYPYWRNTLRKIFNPNSNYQEIIFTGAIGLGKTTIAITAMTYILYQLLCLKDPQEFYKLQSNSEIVIAFFNINLDLSYSVAYKKMQSILMESPWFLDHGTVYGREEKNKYFQPDKKITFRVGSQENHGLGQDIFCLTGDTIINTIDGNKSLEDMYNNIYIGHVYTYNGSKNKDISNTCYVNKIGDTKKLIKLSLEDGTVIRCTPNHKFLLSDNTYKCAKDLTINDDLKTIKD